ncbi:S9 family peptidase [Gloeocapsa sp. PCC 73106]|uniref:S9 family peptidase n=1 Tax=Gloeocapsa sp. PCC 73106 TaxID=102232 RepID=UPI0002ACDF42|nr:S9 family peptidase [Gloeocapsa sp. PCC 73106]ELR99405.1 dipeptidyl aminopeptidase/acylaminoacyl peptidase [Gloeocapsa sp. PCC 73106]
MTKIAPFGAWESPITADVIVAGTIGLVATTFNEQDIYWLEARPQEQGRNVLMRRTRDGQIIEVTPAPFNIRTRVHEYGGGAFLVNQGNIFFVNYSDQCIYHQTLDGQPKRLTIESERRYADLILDSQRNRLICVREDHQTKEPENSLVAVDLTTGEVTTLVSGADFYAAPRLNPEGTQLVWLSWNHPNMPWDHTELWLGNLNREGNFQDLHKIAGNTTESICQPEWSPQGTLYFVSDRANWWNLYRLNPNGEIECVWEMDAEFAYPHWIFGISLYSFASETEIISAYTQQGRWYLAYLNTQNRQFIPLDLLYSEIYSVQVQQQRALLIAASFSQANAIIELDWREKTSTIIRKSSQIQIPSDYLSVPEALAFPTANGLTAYAWYYPPHNPDYQAPSGSLPPLIVKSHGGPTAPASASLSLKTQYWTSRGFAVLDVNYGGSTGYGRDYRQRLVQQWGVVDVDDCVNGAKYLVQQQKVDPQRLAITGGSAGGYTTLAALTFRDTFKAGASYYGVSDLEALAQDTHKFESRYLDGLIGPYPEAKAIYVERSPINFTEQLNCPVIFLQGLEDRVVPPNQTEKMVKALEAKGIPVTYIAFPGEQHGFRIAANIKTALESELAFYRNVFN